MIAVTITKIHNKHSLALPSPSTLHIASSIVAPSCTVVALGLILTSHLSYYHYYHI